jgi:hypothetical protein
MPRVCTAQGPDWSCDRPAKARGLCSAHLSQLARGQTLRPLRGSTPTVRIWLRGTPEAKRWARENPHEARAAIERAARSPP